jgi:hypothetical protein
MTTTTTTTKTTAKNVGSTTKAGTKPTTKTTTSTSTSTTRASTARTDPKKPAPRASKIAIQTKAKLDPKEQLKRIKQLIEKKKLFSGITSVVEKRFNQWKMLTLVEKQQQVQEKNVKTIVTKKRLNIHRIAPKQPEKVQQPAAALHKTYTTIEGGPQTGLNLLSIEEEQKRKDKIKEFLETRINILSISNDILRKYFEKWIGRRTLAVTSRETSKTNLIKKKKIYLIKEKSKSLLEESAKENKDDGLKRIATLPVNETISITGTKTLTEKIVQRASRTSQNVDEILSNIKDDNLRKTLEKEMNKEKVNKFAERTQKNRDDIINSLKKIMGKNHCLKKYFNLWKILEKELETIIEKDSKTTVTKSKIKILKKPERKIEGTEPEVETTRTTESTVIEPSEDEPKSRLYTTETKIIEGERLRAKKKIVVKNLVLNVSRNLMNKYFNIWKFAPDEEEKFVRRGKKRKTIIKKKLINLQRKTTTGRLDDSNQLQNLNLDIPQCPESETPNYLRNVRNVNLIQYFPEDLYSVPSRELILRSNIDVKVEEEKGTKKKKPVVNIQNNIRIIILRNLIKNLSRSLLILYFNLWRYKLPYDEMEKIVKTGKKKISKRKINLLRKERGLEPEGDDGDEEEDETTILRGKVVKKPIFGDFSADEDEGDDEIKRKKK